jgi:hypothetical protein
MRIWVQRQYWILRAGNRFHLASKPPKAPARLAEQKNKANRKQVVLRGYHMLMMKQIEGKRGASVRPRKIRVATRPPKLSTLHVRVVTRPHAKQREGMYFDGLSFLRKMLENACKAMRAVSKL